MKSFAVTDVGKQREINQDFIFRSDENIGIFPNLYIVADGMGGHNAGDYASRFCVEEFVKAVKQSKSKTVLGTMESSVMSTNEMLWNESLTKPELSGMGTTFVATVVLEKTAMVMNVGDSRLYRYSPDYGLVQITVDHSLVEEMIRKGEIERREAVHHPRKNVITRAMGVDKTVLPDFYEIDVNTGDTLVLCSDGLSNEVTEERIAECLSAKNKKVDIKAKELVELANEKGGKDNISVVLVMI